MRVPERIVSLLPSATEMLFALGAGDRVVGVTHECDHPPAARAKPVVVRPARGLASLSPGAIDGAVRESLKAGRSLYVLDEELLRGLSPDLLVTQDLCQVCAPSGNEASRLLASLSPRPEVLYQTPRTLEEVLGCLLELGIRTGTKERAEGIVRDARARIEHVRARTRELPLVRAFFLEWVEPPYCAGHWVPGMLAAAGGYDAFGKEGGESVRVAWEEAVRWDPEVLFVSPCGFNAAQAQEQAKLLEHSPGWEGLSAVRAGRVFALDGNAHFARPGPRLVEGLEILAHLLHPDVLPRPDLPDAFLPV